MDSDSGLHVEVSYVQFGERVHYAAQRVIRDVDHLGGRAAKTPPIIAVMVVAGNS